MNIQVSLQAIVIVALAIVAIAAVIRYKRNGKISLKGPLGTQLDVDGSNKASPGANIEDVDAGGSIRARSETGSGASVKRASAVGDIEATDTTVKPDPKA